MRSREWLSSTGGSDIEARAAVKAAYEYVGPVYLRFGRLAVPVINDGADYKFEIGKGVTLREGSDCSIIATGLCVSEALAAADTLAEQGIHAEVINIHTIKPLDEELVVKTAKKTGRVFTVEEHSIIGGLGAAVAETLGEKCPDKDYQNRCQRCLWRIRSGKRTSSQIRTGCRGNRKPHPA